MTMIENSLTSQKNIPESNNRIIIEDKLCLKFIYRYYKQDKTISKDYLCMGKKRAGSKNANHVELGVYNRIIGSMSPTDPVLCSGV